MKQILKMNKLNKTVLVSILIAFVLGCGSASEQSGIVVIDSKQLVELQKNGALVIDVRTPEEVSEGKIPGALHVQLADDMTSKMSEIDKNQPVIVYCRSGARSTKASLLLQKEGYTTIYNYTGSMNDWLSKGLKVE